MIIHYNNGQEEKLITDILCITIIDGNTPAIVALQNGKELRIRLDRIETILNDNIKNEKMTDKYDFASVVDDIFKECNTVTDINFRFVEMQNILKGLYKQNIALKDIEDKEKAGERGVRL